MRYLRTAQAKASNMPITSYSPIVSLDKTEQVRMRNKFDLAYLLAKEGIAFEKFPALCELEARHKVDLGHAYRTAPSARSFTHYIAKAQRQQFIEDLSEKKFYSFLMDGNTDAGRVEEELVIIQSYRKDDAVQEIRSHARFFAISTGEVPFTISLATYLW